MRCGAQILGQILGFGTFILQGGGFEALGARILGQRDLDVTPGLIGGGSLISMSYTTATGRVATRDEVLAQRDALRRLAGQHRLRSPRLSASGTVVIHSDDPGYRTVRGFATAASGLVGAWVNVITDDASAVQVEATPL